jgi:hypothetical protein
LTSTPFQFASTAQQPNLLIYDDGSIQISTEVYEYEKLVEGKPVLGSVMITHNASSIIDSESFKIGNKPLKVKLIKTVPFASSNIVISIYNFQLEGLPEGTQTLAPISLKVGEKYYQAPPLTITVGSNNPNF